MHRVYNKMIMKMLGIGMGRHQNFMTGPRFFRKLQTDFVNLRGGNIFPR